jgi:hypothetical protein
LPQELGFNLEDSFLIRTLLSDPEDKSVAKDVAQNIQKFYFGDKAISAAVLSSVTDVRNNFLFCLYNMKFSMSIKFGSVMIKGKTENNGT